MLNLIATVWMTCNLVSQDVVNAGTKTNKHMVKQCRFVCQDKSIITQNTNRYEHCPRTLQEKTSRYRKTK
jgi:hypothetical protein